MDEFLYFIRDYLSGTHYFIYSFICFVLLFAIVGYLFKQKYAKVEFKLKTSGAVSAVANKVEDTSKKSKKLFKRDKKDKKEKVQTSPKALNTTVNVNQPTPQKVTVVNSNPKVPVSNQPVANPTPINNQAVGGIPINNQLNNQVNNQFNNQLSKQVNNQVNNQVNTQVNNQVNNQINTQIPNTPIPELKPVIPNNINNGK